MELFDLVFRFLGRFLFRFSPKLSKEQGVLVARSDFRAQLFSLFGWQREVRIDPKLRTIKIRSRSFWAFILTRRLEFDWIDEIYYTTNDSGTGFTAQDVDELYTVSLHLKTNEVVRLFRFFGSGGFVNDGIWPDWMYWPDIVTAQIGVGSQESDSLKFAELLGTMVGVPVGQPLY